MNRHALSAAPGLTLLFTLSLAGGPARADEPTAVELAARALENNTFSTSNARAEVDLEVTKEGSVIRRRRIVTKIKRDDREVRSFVEFVAPADVAGTKFLSIEPRGESSDQFIYLPAFKKVKRVVGAQRSTSFMGTDFSYDDLDGREVDRSTWKRLDDAIVGGQECHVIEGVPKTADDGPYGRTLLWVHKKYFVPMRVDFFDKDGVRIKKRLTVRKLEKLHERWVATDSIMQTIDKGTETRLKLESVDFETPLSAEELSQRALER